jgi:PAS domain S-box-containing protein
MKTSRNYTIKWVAAAAGLLTVLLFFVTSQVKRKAEAQFVENHEAQTMIYCRMLASNLDNHLTHLASAVVSLSAIHSVEQMELDNLENDLASYARAHSPVVRSIFITDNVGSLVFCTSPPSTMKPVIAVSQMNWLRDVASQGKAMAIPIDMSDPNHLNEAESDHPFHLFIFAPVFQTAGDKYHRIPSGQFVGFAGFEIEIELLVSQSVSKAYLPQRSIISIFDEQGQFVFCSEKTSMLDLRRMHRESDCKECHQNGQALSRMISGEAGVGEFAMPDHQPRTAAFVPIGTSGLKWSIIISTPTLEVLAFTRTLSNQYLGIFGGIVFLILLCGWILRQSERRRIRLSALSENLTEVTEIKEALEKDISERKQAEEALRESEELYRSLFENMLNGFAYCRMIFEQERPRDFVYLRVNSTFETLTGLKNVVGKRVSEVIPGIQESDQELFEIYGRVALTGKPEKFEIFVEALNMWFSISVYSPKREHFVAVFDVITERKQAEEALRESEEHFRTVADHTYEWEYWVAPDNRLLFVSPSCERISGYRASEFLEDAKLLQRIVHPDDADLVSQHFSCVGDAKDKAAEVDFRIITKDNEVRWITHCCVAVFSRDGCYLGRRASNRDITARRQAEDRRRKNAKNWRLSCGRLKSWRRSGRLQVELPMTSITS